ncbi:hypothetical protein BaRGS_00039076, partial [Batillaria attramentaria]
NACTAIQQNLQKINMSASPTLQPSVLPLQFSHHQNFTNSLFFGSSNTDLKIFRDQCHRNVDMHGTHSVLSRPPKKLHGNTEARALWILPAFSA